jgi:hypothetical protein
MENAEGRKAAKVWPRDFIGIHDTSNESESSKEIELENNLEQDQPVEEKDEEIKEAVDEEIKESVKEENVYSKRKGTILTVKPIHVEAKIIDIK